MTLVDAMLHGNTCLRELDARINAHGLFGIVGNQGKHVAAVVAANLKHVGKVVLALRVVVRNAGKRVEKRRRIEAVETGVAFVDGSLFRRCVLLLDDAGNRIAFAFAHNATIPERIVHLHGEHHHGGVRLFALGDKGRDGFRGDQRTVAREDNQRTLGDRAVFAGHGFTSGINGIARAKLLRLDDDLSVGLDQGSHLFAHMAKNGNNVGNTGIVRCIDDPADKRLAQNLMCHLGLLRLHTSACTRSKNQSFSVHARTFFASTIRHAQYTAGQLQALAATTKTHAIRRKQMGNGRHQAKRRSNMT